jgi:hypothetical protein
MRVGVVSDTHGRLHERVLELFAGVDRILHAGDVGSEDVLTCLRAVAPVTAVCGNMDRYAGATRLSEELRLEIEGLAVVVVHDGAKWLRSHDPVGEGVGVLVTGHTHRPVVESFDGYVHLNPGSASRAGAGGTRTVALLEVHDGRPQAKIVPLGVERV